MKKGLLLCAIFISSIAFSQATNSVEDRGQKLPGWIITKKGEKIEGYVKRLVRIRSQRKVKFFATKDAKAKDYGPKDIKAYQVGEDYYESLPYEGLTGKKKVFLLRTVKGKISVFNYYIRVEDDQGSEINVTKGNKEIILDLDGTKIQVEALAVKNGKDLLKFASPKTVFSFRKIMSKYVSDYPELAKKVKNKEKGYKVTSVLKIIDEYNAHFAE